LGGVNAPALALPPAPAPDADVEGLPPAPAGVDAVVLFELAGFDELHDATRNSAVRTANAAGMPCLLE